MRTQACKQNHVTNELFRHWPGILGRAKEQGKKNMELLRFAIPVDKVHWFKLYISQINSDRLYQVQQWLFLLLHGEGMMQGRCWGDVG